MNILRYTLPPIFAFVVCTCLSAQMVVQGDTLFGNEWINYDQSYFKISVVEDGMYRISYEVLSSAGVPLASIRAADLELWWMGREQPIHVTTTGTLGPGDYLEFYGRRNRSELDRFLFENPGEEMLNPEYSLHSDTSSYYLSWSEGSHPRFETLENDLGGTLPAKRDWYLHTEQLVLSESHFKPLLNSQGVRFSHYLEGEGFASREGTNHTFDLAVADLAPTGPEPSLHFRMTGNTQLHAATITWNNQMIFHHSFPGSNGRGGAPLIDTSVTLSRDRLQATNQFSAASSGEMDRIRFGTIALSYPRHFAFSSDRQFSLSIGDARDGAYLELAGLNAQVSHIVFDLSSGFRLPLTFDNGIGKVNLPPGPNQRELVILPEPQMQQVTDLRNVNLERLDASNASYLIVSNPKLYQDEQGTNWVQEYAAYRSTTIGGGHAVQVVDVYQLIDQFAYGVDMHPLSVKNFVNYITRNWTRPQFLLLIGKGLNYGDARHAIKPYEYLPVYGQPGSDNLLTSRGSSSTPLLPVGRLAVSEPNQIGIYLDKIKIMEDQIANAPQSIASRAWMKRALHLSAGDSPNEQNIILAKMNEMANILEAGDLGMEVTTVSRQSNDIIEGSVNEKTLRLINDGIMIKSYFGHGAVTTTQFQGYEDPFFLNNEGKYPLMLALGCHTGNVFTNAISLGESNVLTESKGAIAYIATSGLGFLSALDIFGKDWYDELSSDFFEKSLGGSIKSTISKHDQNLSIPIRTLMQQLVLHGDPAFRISKADAPDYLIDATTVRLDPDVIESEQDSFLLSFEILNLGLQLGDTLSLTIKQITPAEEEVDLGVHRLHAQQFRSQASIRLPLRKLENMVGLNRILVELDPENLIREASPGGEMNNELISPDGRKGVNFVIYEAGIVPSFPVNFGIHTSDTITLTAITSAPLAPLAKYQLQVDTTALFDSPLLREHITEETRGIVNWLPPVEELEGQVYYWRVRRLDSDESSIWYSSSFLYQPGGRNGFNQSHYYQFLANSTTNLNIDSVTRRITFAPSFNDFQIKNVASRSGTSSAGVFVNGSSWSDFFRWEVTEGLTFIINDPNSRSGFKFNTRPGQYGSVNNTAARIASFPFTTKTIEDRTLIIDFLEKHLEPGQLVFMYTTQAQQDLTLSVQDWASDSLSLDGRNLFNILEGLGASRVRELENGAKPYVFAFRKGHGLVAEMIATGPDGLADLKYSLPKASSTGLMRSVPIGPASEWHNIDVNIARSHGDSSSLKLFGRRPLGRDEALIGESIPDLFDIRHISSDEYPYLSLDLFLQDMTNQTAPDLGNWRVYFEGFPDLSYSFDHTVGVACDTLEVGQKIQLNLPIHNPSPDSWSDSIFLEIVLRDEQNQEIRHHRTIAPLASGEYSTTSAEFDIDQLRGKITLISVINPRGLQSELYQNNNLLTKCYFKSEDVINPIIDVTFDGRRILDGEIISAQPHVSIRLRDENNNSPLTDSNSVDIYYFTPGGAKIKVDADSPLLQYETVLDSANELKVDYFPVFSELGDYEFHVNGRDNNGNPAGKLDYIVNFSISDEKTFSDIYPFPNPFTTSCRFSYTLNTSFTVPNLSIRIMALDGTIVKEITSEELGPLSPGTHLTDFQWDGTDTYGDKLANGIYLYKVITSDFKQKIAASRSAFFEKGLGKIAILR